MDGIDKIKMTCFCMIIFLLSFVLFADDEDILKVFIEKIENAFKKHDNELFFSLFDFEGTEENLVTKIKEGFALKKDNHEFESIKTGDIKDFPEINPGSISGQKLKWHKPPVMVVIVTLKGTDTDDKENMINLTKKYKLPCYLKNGKWYIAGGKFE